MVRFAHGHPKLIVAVFPNVDAGEATSVGNTRRSCERPAMLRRISIIAIVFALGCGKKGSDEEQKAAAGDEAKSAKPGAASVAGA